MCEESPQKKMPCFSTLADIMEHFHRVPFEQFKSDLNNWFQKSLKEEKIDLTRLNGENTSCFPEQLKQLVEDIFYQAEVMQQKQGSNG